MSAAFERRAVTATAGQGPSVQTLLQLLIAPAPVALSTIAARRGDERIGGL